MPRGGLRNPPGGRPLGSKDRVPRRPHHHPDAVNKLKQMVIDAEESEYLFKNNKEPFDGNALALMTAVYKCNQIDIKTRLYAASKAVEHEPTIVDDTIDASEGADEVTGKLIEQLHRKRQVRLAERDGKLRKWIASGVVSEDLAREIRTLYADTSQGDEPFDAVGHVGKAVHISELTPPPPPVVVRKRNPGTIDENADAKGASEPVTASISADDVQTASRPTPQKPPVEELIETVTRGPGGRPTVVYVRKPPQQT